jgi:hypothetical protein
MPTSSAEDLAVKTMRIGDIIRTTELLLVKCCVHLIIQLAEATIYYQVENYYFGNLHNPSHSLKRF